MREIEFRGKHTHTGEWHYGYLVYVPVDNSYKITQGKEISYFVDTDTIGQYTGLKDKNGTKIFEGDIVKYFSPYVEIVCFIEFRDCHFELRKIEDNSLCYHLGKSLELEVIGNIYDNPELLK